MINQVNSQPMISCPQMNMPKQEAKNLIISPSLMMMLLEWASKQGENDMTLHQALENMMSFNDGINPLKIDCFDCIVPETVEVEPCCQEVDIKNYNEEDKECVSNTEIESFWDGYESVSPMEIQCCEEPCDQNCCDQECIPNDLQSEIDNIINSCVG